MSVNKVDKTTGNTTLIAGSTLWADSPIGTILAYGGATAPSGWMLCQGQAISRTTYSELFAVIGTSFGTGDGSTTFNLPDLREATTKGAGLTGKSNNHYDSDGVALGEFVEDRVQDHTHNFATDGTTGATWAVISGNKTTNNPSAVRGFKGGVEGASARKGDTTEVKAVGVNFIIKAKMVAMPSDFMSKVDEAVGEAIEEVFANNAGAHNSIYRGKYLGSSVTAEQYAQIDAGTFDDLFIGDYWTIDGVDYEIADFDYWLRTGDTECTTHHVVVVPKANMYTAKMNDSNVTTGGYTGSKMYTANLADAKTTINTAFGSAHILNHRELFTNAVTSDKASGRAWYDSTVDLMNECMVYGHCAWASHPGYDTGIDKSQLSLFRLRPERITNRADWWLRSVVSSANFADVGASGHADLAGASIALGVRPAFAIIG